MGFWPLVESVIRKSDILIVILDARMPEYSRNIEIEKKIFHYNKPYVIVFTKIDLLSKESLKELKAKYPETFFVSGTRNIGIGDLRKRLQILAKKLKIDEPRIGVVGYPNIGKSALINALARRKKTEVADKPGTTRGIQWIKAGRLSILDTPGVIPYEDKNSKLVFIGSKKVEGVSNPDKVAFKILEIFLEKNKKLLEERYKISIETEETYEIFLAIGKKRGLLKKGGEVDETKTALIIIQDWQKGRLHL